MGQGPYRDSQGFHLLHDLGVGALLGLDDTIKGSVLLLEDAVISLDLLQAEPKESLLLLSSANGAHLHTYQRG